MRNDKKRYSALKVGFYSLSVSFAAITLLAAVVMTSFSTPFLGLGIVLSALAFIPWLRWTSNKYDAFGIGTYLLLITVVLMWFQPHSSTLIATPIHNKALTFLGAYTLFHFIRMGKWTYEEFLFAKKDRKLLVGNFVFTVILACTYLAGLAKVELSCSTLVANSLLFSYIPALTCTYINLD